MLTLHDYLTTPFVELATHDEYDPDAFEVAHLLNQAPMNKLKEGIDATWLKSFNSSGS